MKMNPFDHDRLEPDFPCPEQVDENSTKDELARWIAWQRFIHRGSRNPKTFRRALMLETKKELMMLSTNLIRSSDLKN